MSVCSVCDTAVTTRSKVTCSECKNSCHPNCVNMTKAEIDCIIHEKQIWRCPPCSKIRRQSMKAVTDAEEGNPTISQVIFMLDEASKDRKRMESDFNKAFEFADRKTDEQKLLIANQTEELKKCMKIIEDLKNENNNLVKKVKDLELRLDDVEQYSRSNNIEILGVPEEKNEDVFETVKKVCTALDVHVERNNIDVCHRLKKPQDSHWPATIIVRFVQRDLKNQVLSKRRVKRNFSTLHCGYQSTSAPIYINENLCFGRKKLYKAAREAKKDKNYTFLWVRNGNILMRESEESPVKRITCLEDLEKL